MPSISSDAGGSPNGLAVQNSSTPGIDPGNFSFSNVLGNLWGDLKPLMSQGLDVYGQVEIAKAQANAQAARTKNAAVNPSLAPPDPNAAQAVAGQTLAQQWLPGTAAGNANFTRLIIGGLVVLAVLLIVRKVAK